MVARVNLWKGSGRGGDSLQPGAGGHSHGIWDPGQAAPLLMAEEAETQQKLVTRTHTGLGACVCKDEDQKACAHPHWGTHTSGPDAPVLPRAWAGPAPHVSPMGSMGGWVPLPQSRGTALKEVKPGSLPCWLSRSKWPHPELASSSQARAASGQQPAKNGVLSITSDFNTQILPQPSLSRDPIPC